jgi:hypothetical protein
MTPGADNGGNGNGGNGNGGDNGAGGAPISNLWSFASLLVVVAGLIVITVYVVGHYKLEATDAGTILGIVIPAFATIGAAIFGVTVAYKAGAKTGEQEGTKKGKRQAADKVDAELNRAQNVGTPILETITREGTSGAGTDEIVIGPSNPVTFAQSDLHRFSEQIARLRGVVNGLRA